METIIALAPVYKVLIASGLICLILRMGLGEFMIDVGKVFGHPGLWTATGILVLCWVTFVCSAIGSVGYFITQIW